MANIRDLKRGDHIFVVEDTPVTASWHFWDLWTDGHWEAATLDYIASALKPGDRFYDIGAWVGPIALWAGKLGARVLALEPDPLAYQLLRLNCSMNPQLDITTVEAALGADDGTIAELFYTEGAMGDSTSSLTRTEANRMVMVRAIHIAELMARYPDPALVKMDIEGGESLLLPVVGPILRDAGVPLILALHPQWYTPGGQRAIEQELSYWKIEHLRDDNLVCTPR